MKLCTVSLASEPPFLGVVLSSGLILDLNRACELLFGKASPLFHSMQDWIEGGSESLALARSIAVQCESNPPEGLLFSADSLKFHAPLPRPLSIRDCLAFEQHLVNATKTVISWKSALLANLNRVVERVFKKSLAVPPKVWYERPIYYKGNPFSVIGCGDAVIWPSQSSKLDYECEFGIIIGKKGKDIPVENAAEYIAGYLIFNDFSARDVQMEEMGGRLGPAKSKDFDTGNAMGPYLVTPDEVDPGNLTMTARVNGELWTSGNSGDMHFSFAEIIAYISQDETLYPGECIGSGTVGNGCGLEHGKWLKRGDVIELEVTGLGILKNRIL